MQQIGTTYCFLKLIITTWILSLYRYYITLFHSLHATVQHTHRSSRPQRQHNIGTVGTLKFGFGALVGTFWATFRITADRLRMEISRFWATFCQCLAP